MSQDPNASFDRTVLERIEQSPTGVVPRTPAHDDAIKRLLTAQQIYANADHHDGYVSVRALARLPTFHAANWEEFVGNRIGGELLEPNASVFNRYVASLAAENRGRAETLRVKIAGKPVLHRVRPGHAEFHDPVHSLFLVPGSGPGRGLPGNYLSGALVQLGAELRSGAWAIDLHDAEDNVVLFDAPDLRAAAEKLDEVLASAPFYLWELESLGFRRK
ncbi:MAG TPA: hypothetical protein VNR00_19885 [Opitutus sp.]|nr:hypothetical protein [Opitutus sp.]